MTGSLRGAALGRGSKVWRALAAGKVFALAMMAVPLGSSSARAQNVTGELFIRLCRDRTSKDWAEMGHYFCPGYVRGMIEGARLQALHDAGGEIVAHYRLLAICEPKTATVDQGIEIVVRHLDGHPEMLPKPAAAAAFQALASEWPCRP